MVHEESKNGSREDVEENIFRQIAIPRTLGNIPMEKVEKELFVGPTLPTYHKVVTGISDPQAIREDIHEHSSSSDGDSDSDESEQG